MLLKFVNEGWPEKSHLNTVLQPFWQYRGEITAPNGLLMYGTRIIIPSALRMETLDKIHDGHQGITKCRRRALQSVWWPGICTQIESMVKSFRICCKEERPHPLPLVPSEFPSAP